MLEILLVAATLLGGIAALWFFYDRFFGRGQVTRQKVDRERSEEYNERGRKRVQSWGEAMAQGEWNWEYLGQALEYYFDSIRYDPSHQHPWTNLAFVYHLTGATDKARKCLSESRRLASPGPNHPGRNYKHVAQAIDNETTLSGHQLSRPPMPDSFNRKYGTFLQSVPGRRK